MVKIVNVKEFNRTQRQKYNEAVSKWKPSKGGFPSLAMYLYLNEKTGEPRKIGYVGFTKHGSVWAKTKKSVRKLM